MDKNFVLCTKCKRELKELAFDKCMYCGELIPEEFRLSEVEKQNVLDKKQRNFEEQEVRHRKKKETDRRRSEEESIHNLNS